MQNNSPLKDWNWDKEVQSQILHGIDILITQYANSHRKKGTPAQKPPKQLQPDYVERGKKELRNRKKEDGKETQKELAAFFEKRNNKTKKMEEIVNGY